MTHPSFTQAKAQYERNYEALKLANAELQSFLSQFPPGPMGLTSDHVKAMPEFRRLKGAFERQFQAVRSFNSRYTKIFKAELNAERRAKLHSLPSQNY